MPESKRFSPETLDEAAALLAATNSRVRPQARGTDLIAQVTEAQRTLSLIVDLRRVPEFNRLDYDERNGLRIGAAVPPEAILAFPPVRTLYPMLADGFSAVDPAEMQGRATLGETLAEAAASSRVVPPLICLRASAAVYGPHGWSEMGLEVLFAGSGRGGLQPGEFVVDIRLPAPPPRSNGAYLRLAPPEDPDIAVVGVGAFLAMERDLVTCCGARLAFSGGPPTLFRVLDAERFLAGKRLDDAVLKQAGELAARICRPTGDAGGSAEDRFDRVSALTRRAILVALERVRAAAG